MKNKKGFMYLGIVLVAVPAYAVMDPGPYVSSGSCDGVQEEVLAFAKKAYDSSVFNLSDYNSLEKAADRELDSPELTFLTGDLIGKKEVVGPQFSTEFSWPKQMADRPATFVKTRRPFNWRGDWYALYWVPTSDLSRMMDEAKETFEEEDIVSYKVLKENLWQEPFFISVKSKEEIIGVIPSPLYSPISEWSVYVPTQTGELSACQIQFHPKTQELNVTDSKNQVSYVASQLFSKKGALCSLVKLLDNILGPGTNEGTLQPTAGIRVHVCQLMINMALRPWVVESMDKDSWTKEKIHVDKNLEKWALKNKSFLKQTQEMKRLYPLAEKELKDYYQVRFGKTARQAESLAKETLARLYTSFFDFPSH